MYRKETDLKLLPLVVHYKPDSMATILSLKSVSEIDGAHLVMNTSINKHTTLTLKDRMSYVLNNLRMVYIFWTPIMLNILSKLKPRYQIIHYFKP